MVATGRSDFANQINNVLAFPGIFLGALDCGAKRITEGMKVAAAGAICAAVPGRAVADRIVPDPFTPGLARMVADAVIAAARAEGVARVGALPLRAAGVVTNPGHHLRPPSHTKGRGPQVLCGSSGRRDQAQAQPRRRSPR